MLSKVENAVVPASGKLMEQKKFLSGQLKKISSNIKTIKNYEKFKDDYDKLVKYYNIFKKNLK